MTKLAYLIAQEEGFFKAGTLPRRRNNPGDLRHSPHSEHSTNDPNAIGDIDTEDHGWEDLERQLQLDAERGMTMEQLVYTYAPPEENDSAKYLADLCTGLKCGPRALVSDVLSGPKSLMT